MKSTDEKTPKLPIFKERFSELADKYPNKTEFAKFLGITQQTVNYWLNGERVPDAPKLIQIAQKTGVSIDWLLGISTSKTPKAEIKAICDHTGLSDKAIDALSDTTKRMQRTIDVLLSTEIVNDIVRKIGIFLDLHMEMGKITPKNGFQNVELTYSNGETVSTKVPYDYSVKDIVATIGLETLALESIRENIEKLKTTISEKTVRDEMTESLKKALKVVNPNA